MCPDPSSMSGPACSLSRAAQAWCLAGYRSPLDSEAHADCRDWSAALVRRRWLVDDLVAPSHRLVVAPTRAPGTARRPSPPQSRCLETIPLRTPHLFSRWLNNRRALFKQRFHCCPRLHRYFHRLPSVGGLHPDSRASRHPKRIRRRCALRGQCALRGLRGLSLRHRHLRRWSPALCAPLRLSETVHPTGISLRLALAIRRSKA